MKSLRCRKFQHQHFFCSSKKIFGVTVILFLNILIISSVMATDTSEQEMMDLFRHNTQRFSLNLFAAINEHKPDVNLIFSPFSIHTCLALAYAGAKNKTAEELLKGLRLVSNNSTVVGQSFKNVLDNYQNNDALKIANKFYVKTGYAVTPEFNKIANKYFYSEAQNLNFAKNVDAANTMNGWVEEKTNGKITNLISPDLLDDDTRMVIINAIYFKAAWMNQFKQELTAKHDFWINEKDKIEVDMMNTKAKFLYGNFSELNATAIEMPYRNGFSMFIILPNEKTGLALLEKKLETIDLLELKGDMTRCDVTVKLPKFKVSMEIKLRDTLTKMGMGTMFTKEANFSKLLSSPEPLQVSEVIHQAYIEVNEFGSEAAAATAAIVRMRRSINFPHPETKEFIADHPIFYAIIDNQENILLFSGSIRSLTEVNYHDEL